MYQKTKNRRVKVNIASYFPVNIVKMCKKNEKHKMLAMNLAFTRHVFLTGVGHYISGLIKI